MPPHSLMPQRIVAPGGPVSAALRAVLTHAAACDRQRLRDLRRVIADRITADLALLDALEGDADFELGADAELTAVEGTGQGVHRFNTGVAA